MGYFDALTSSSFQTRDGRRLFFPWGKLGHAYVIDTDQAYERLRSGTKAFYVIMLPAAIGATLWRGILIGLAVGAIGMAFYWFGVRIAIAGLSRVDATYSMSEAFANRAQTQSPIFLWIMIATSLVFVLLGIGMLLLSPKEWMAACGVSAFFGASACLFIRQLRLRSRMKKA